MDVNGTRFHLVLREDEWLAPSVAAGDASFLDGGLQLRAELPLFPARRDEQPPDTAVRLGAGRDRYGNWYWITADGAEIRVAYSGRHVAVHFWSAADSAGEGRAKDGDFAPAAPLSDTSMRLAGLAVTNDHFLVVGRRDRGALLVFDLHGGGAPVELPWPRNVPFVPADIAPGPDGGAWVLDATNRLLWRLDRWMRVVSSVAIPGAAAGEFAPTGGAASTPSSSDVVAPREVTLRAARSLADLAAPSRVEALPDGGVLVLDDAPAEPAARVAYYGPRHEGPRSVVLDASLSAAAVVGGAAERQPLPMRPFDLAAVATADVRRRVQGILYLVAADGNQTIAFDLRVRDGTPSLRLRPDYLPMRRFGGRGLVAVDGKPYYDSGDRWLPLAEQPNPRFATAATIALPVEATAFDGREPQCVWHRLLFDGCVPPDTRVVVACRAADAPELLEGLPWREQPAPYRRRDGAELPWYEPPIDGGAHAGTYELLLQDVVGRYVQLRLTLRGNGRASPRIRALRIYYPRFSYLSEYLPAAYREDRVSASFLDRFLANVEGFYTTLEGRIAEAQVLMDADTVPARYLDWLAGWMGITLDRGWSDATKRLFLHHAPQYFRERGTCAGLVRALRLALSPCASAALFADAPCASAAPGFGIRVIDGFRTRSRSRLTLGDPSEALGDVRETAAWTPAEGAEPLHQRWRDYLRARYGTPAALASAWHAEVTSFDDPSLRLPAVRPDDCRRRDWLRFVREGLGFVYPVITERDLPLYREFLARRYAQAAAVNAAYGLSGGRAIGSFADVDDRLWRDVLARTLPPGGAWLRDWMEFATTVLPLDHGAHRFTVLVPVGLDDTVEDQRTRRAVAERVARLEKPAHADFDVRLYWGMFRVGEARVALDTLLGPGSRSVAIVLDRSLVGAGHLGWPDALRATGRVGASDEMLPDTPAACCTRT